MWIHHSCGSLMKIQMAAAERITVHLPMCLVSQPRRTASTNRKKYSKVFGKMKRTARTCVSSKATTPIIR